MAFGIFGEVKCCHNARHIPRHCVQPSVVPPDNCRVWPDLNNKFKNKCTRRAIDITRSIKSHDLKSTRLKEYVPFYFMRVHICRLWTTSIDEEQNFVIIIIFFLLINDESEIRLVMFIVIQTKLGHSTTMRNKSNLKHTLYTLQNLQDYNHVILMLHGVEFMMYYHHK